MATPSASARCALIVRKEVVDDERLAAQQQRRRLQQEPPPAAGRLRLYIAFANPKLGFVTGDETFEVS